MLEARHVSKRKIVSFLVVALSFSAACSTIGVSLGGDGAGGGNGGNSSLNAGGSAPNTGGSAAGASGASSGGVAGALPNTTCENPQLLDGNWILCDNGTRHRETPGQCPFRPSSEWVPSKGGADECTKDADCTERPNGYCQDGIIFDDPNPPNYCVYSCKVDADCPANNVCVCRVDETRSVGHCVDAKCSTDGDCASGFLCTDYIVSPGCPEKSFACQTSSDECASDDDCTFSLARVCTVVDDRRKCEPYMCAAGM